MLYYLGVSGLRDSDNTNLATLTDASLALYSDE